MNIVWPSLPWLRPAAEVVAIAIVGSVVFSLLLGLAIWQLTGSESPKPEHEIEEEAA